MLSFLFYNKNLGSRCPDSATCELLEAILTAEFDRFRTRFRALSAVVGARIWYLRFAEDNFLLYYSVLYSSNVLLAPFLTLLPRSAKLHISHTLLAFLRRIRDHRIRIAASACRWTRHRPILSCAHRHFLLHHVITIHQRYTDRPTDVQTDRWLFVCYTTVSSGISEC